jgi:hypothetical protein
MSARQWDEQQQKQVVFAISQKAPVVCHNSVAYSVYMHIDCFVCRTVWWAVPRLHDYYICPSSERGLRASVYNKA